MDKQSTKTIQKTIKDLNEALTNLAYDTGKGSAIISLANLELVENNLIRDKSITVQGNDLNECLNTLNIIDPNLLKNDPMNKKKKK